MRVLGARLLDGDGLPADPAAGRSWLEQAARAKEPQAMRVLGARLLDEKGLLADPAAGRFWLEQAAGAGDTLAMGNLGARLLDGDGLPADPAAGQSWLEQAAGAGEALAMRVLGDRLLDGRGLPADPAAGRSWLTKAAEAGDAEARVRLAVLAYKAGRYREAAEAFRDALPSCPGLAGNNLAFMLRRGEVPADIPVPPVATLLAAGLSEAMNFAELNWALCLACGFQMAADWVVADGVIQKLKDPRELVGWWHPLAKGEDPEGHLVLGWLARHGLIADPDGWPVEKRLRAARQGGWDVPGWLDAPPA
jgi:TPR repeat protein